MLDYLIALGEEVLDYLSSIRRGRCKGRVEVLDYLIPLLDYLRVSGREVLRLLIVVTDY